MKIKAVSGLKFIVSNPIDSADFYEKLGFIITSREADISSVRSNWFWVEFTKGVPSSSEAHMAYLSVDNVEDTQRELISLNFDPTDLYESHNRKEVSITDLDGYKLVFFQKK